MSELDASNDTERYNKIEILTPMIQNHGYSISNPPQKSSKNLRCNSVINGTSDDSIILNMMPYYTVCQSSWQFGSQPLNENIILINMTQGKCYYIFCALGNSQKSICFCLYFFKILLFYIVLWSKYNDQNSLSKRSLKIN